MTKINICPGFTLLEVLIAITLTGLVMGSLFAMQSQNKQLTFRSLSTLERLTAQREIVNTAWIGLTPADGSNYRIENKKFIEVPESLSKQQEKIQKYNHQLQSLDITDLSHQILFSTVRLVKKE
jgi:prepilin-type N-terminal cleavage/methylation domain-containing protein